MTAHTIHPNGDDQVTMRARPISSVRPVGRRRAGRPRVPSHARSRLQGAAMSPDPRYEQDETDAAAAEAARIGGVAGDEDLDPAQRPVIEAGGGEAEGFESAEEALIEHASHGDQQSAHA